MITPPLPRRSGVLLLAGLLAVLAMVACNKAESSTPKRKADSKAKGPLTVQVTTPAASEGDDVVLGTIQANRAITITPQASGRITKIHAKIGDYVKAGSPLVTLDTKDADLGIYRASASAGVAKAAVRVAETGLANAYTEYKRFKKLHEQGTIPEATFTKVKTGWLMAKAQVNLAKKQLALAHAGLATTYKMRKDAVTKAPFSGFVTRIMMHEGDMVRSMPPSHVMRLTDVNPVVVEASIGELRLATLPKAGTPIKLVIPGLGGRVLRPKMSDVLPALNPITRAATLRIELPNPKRTLKVGLSVEIHLAGSKSRQLTLPLSAVTKKGGDDAVYRVGADGLLARVSVTLGPRQGPRVVVRSGVGPKDRIVQDATQAGLDVGVRVQVAAAQ